MAPLRSTKKLLGTARSTVETLVRGRAAGDALPRRGVHFDAAQLQTKR
jgi:hypothetical protein